MIFLPNLFTFARLAIAALSSAHSRKWWPVLWGFFRASVLLLSLLTYFSAASFWRNTLSCNLSCFVLGTAESLNRNIPSFRFAILRLSFTILHICAKHAKQTSSATHLNLPSWGLVHNGKVLSSWVTCWCTTNGTPRFCPENNTSRRTSKFNERIHKNNKKQVEQRHRLFQGS